MEPAGTASAAMNQFNGLSGSGHRAAGGMMSKLTHRDIHQGHGTGRPSCRPHPTCGRPTGAAELNAILDKDAGHSGTARCAKPVRSTARQ